MQRFVNRSEVVSSIFQINVSIYFSDIMIHSILRPKWRQAFGDEPRDADRPSIVFQIMKIRSLKCIFKSALLYCSKENPNFLTESVLLKAFAALVLARIFCMALLGFEGGV